VTDAAALLTVYDAQLRLESTPPAVGWDGPLQRCVFPGHNGYVTYRDLAGLRGPALDQAIARQVAFFAELGIAFEWKVRGHDEPADLVQRLTAAGFVPEPQESVIMGAVDDVLAGPAPTLPAEVTVRAVSSDDDLARIAALEEQVWAEDRSWLAPSLAAERDRNPDALLVVIAEAAGEVVSAGWLRFEPGGEVASLWGGSTLAPWRRRGLYRALVGYRAQRARARGCRWLQIDASDDSRPILERLGLVTVTTTTPYIWTPAG
jgi:GNAT superfamily N-acetyltransferase